MHGEFFLSFWHGIRTGRAVGPKSCVMKQWITLVLATAVFTSCSKESLQEEDAQTDKEVASAAMRLSEAGSYVSGWENYSTWERSEQGDVTIFTYQRKTAETAVATNNGLVLTYAKVASADPLYSSFNSPKMLPFYFLPEGERPRPQTYYFTTVVVDGNISLIYRAPFTKQAMPTLGGGASLQNVQFQHVVLSSEFLQSKGLTASTVRNNYTYQQVMNLID